MIEISLSTFVFTVIAIISAIWALLKMYFLAEEKRISAHFESLSADMAGHKKDLLDMHQKINGFEAELPKIYLRRDQYQGDVNLLHEKINSLAHQTSAVEGSLDEIKHNLRLMMNNAITKGMESK